MAQNFDGVWELRIFYTTTPTGFLPMQHRHTLDVRVVGEPTVGTAFGSIPVELAAGGTTDLENVVTNYTALLDDLFSTGDTIDFAELWKIPEGTYDATWVSTMSIGVPGTSTLAAGPAYQMTITFRTAAGGIARAQFMETWYADNGRFPFPTSSGDVNDVAAFVAGENSPFVGRDNADILIALAYNSGQNEKLWRKRYRPT